jgi:hypothetical protein
MVTRSRCIILDPGDLREHPLGIPVSDEAGPDLTFIEIFSGPKLDSLKAIVSFWRLDQKHYELAKTLSAPGIVLVEAGFPEIDYRTKIIDSVIHHELKHTVFWAALKMKIFLRRESGITSSHVASTELLRRCLRHLRDSVAGESGQ